MKNPLQVFQALRDMYLRYLDSPFDLRYDDLVSERRDLVDRDHRIYRHPILEPVAKYRKCGSEFGDICRNLLQQTWQPQEISDLTDFTELGLFPERSRSVYAPARLFRRGRRKWWRRSCDDGYRIWKDRVLFPSDYWRTD